MQDPGLSAASVTNGELFFVYQFNREEIPASDDHKLWKNIEKIKKILLFKCLLLFIPLVAFTHSSVASSGMYGEVFTCIYPKNKDCPLILSRGYAESPFSTGKSTINHHFHR